MDVPALDATGDLNWQLFHNDNGYYETAEGFDAFIDEIEDIEIDLADDPDPEDLKSELTMEEVYALAAFNHLTMRYLAAFTSDEVSEWADLAEGDIEMSDETPSLGEYVDS